MSSLGIRYGLVRLGRIGAHLFASPTQDPIGVEGGTHTCGTHAVFSGHGVGLPFCTGRPSFGRQVFRGCLFAIGEGLILLHPCNVGPVHHLRIPFQVIESALLLLLLGPLLQVFQGKVIPLVNLQRGVHGQVPPTETGLVLEPLVDVPDDGGHQVADAAESTPI